MDRETFIHSIEITDTDIRTAFESLMALYSLYNSVGVYDNMKIAKTPSELASFDITYNDSEFAKKVYDTCDGVYVSIYDVKYNVSCTLNGNIVHIKLK